MHNKVNILMTGAGAPGAAGILHCLQQEAAFSVHTADAGPSPVGRFLSGNFTQIPFASDSDFIPAVLELSKVRKIDVILPLVTRELGPLAANLSRFAMQGTRVLVSTPEALEISNDKGRLYEFLQWRGVAVPAFRIVETIGQFVNAINELSAMNTAVCFKPTISNGSRGFRLISDDIDELDLLLNHKPGTAVIRRAEAIRILASGPFPPLLVTEYLPGEEYSVDCLANKGMPRIIAPRLRKKMINGISVEGSFEYEPEIIEYCRRIIQELKLHGNIGIQVRKSKEGEARILEINPRVQGTISAGLGAGLNLPVLAIKQEIGVPISQEEMNIAWGTAFSRYWSETFYR